MDSKGLLKVIAVALTSVTDPHYYEDERGFQGESYAQLRLRLRDLPLPEGALPSGGVPEEASAAWPADTAGHHSPRAA